MGKKQTFPFLKNKEIYAVAVLRTGSEKEKIGIVPCGENMFPRLIEVPERTGCYILSEELILHYLPLLFGSYRIASKTLAQNKNVSLTLFAFDKDEEISSHQSTGDAMIQVLEGKARIMVGKEFFEVSEGESILMPHDVDHAVYALEPMKMCLTVVFPYER